VPAPLSKQAIVLVKACAYAGTGNVLKIQELLQVCKEHVDPEKEDDAHQAFAVLGIALIAMGEEIGSEMAIRMFNHLMHYGELVIRRAVPLALGLLCICNPQEVSVIDTLSKYTHDNDAEVSQAAIFALGLVGAGTNNARVAQLLRQLAQYYQKDPNNLFIVRLAQVRPRRGVRPGVGDDADASRNRACVVAAWARACCTCPRARLRLRRTTPTASSCRRWPWPACWWRW